MGAERRQPQNAALREMHERLQERYERFSKRMLLAVSIIAFFVFLGLVLEGFIISDLHHEVDRRTHDNEQLLSQIQQSRVQASMRSCLQRNAQNAAILSLIPSDYEPRPGKALAIIKDCHAFALGQTRTP